VLDVHDRVRREPGVIIPIADVPEVSRETVSIEGEIIELWPSRYGPIQEVGLIADDSGVIKFTAWISSNCRSVEEGEYVRIRAAARNWYQGRCSIALTGESRVRFPNREPWWM
jgi:ssDNA-binding replication factor A large subunit